MGKSSLILVFGLSLIIAFIILKINSNATQGVETTVNKFDQTHARLIANSAVEIQLEKLRRNKSLNGNFAGNLFAGTYFGNISPEDANGRIIIRSNGLFQNVSHYVRVDAERKQVNPPPSLGAMRIITKAFEKLIIDGGLYISGFDHSPYYPYDRIDSLPAIPGITVDTQGQIDTLADKKLGINANAEVLGLSPLINDKYSISKSDDDIDWVEISEDIASSADTIIIGDSTGYRILNNFVIGTLDNPKIVRIDGNVQITSDNSSGAGILVVNGNISFKKLTWLGFIVAYKDSKIEITLNGGATVIGGMLLSGDKVDIRAGNGGFTLKHSSLVMQFLQNNLVSSRFKVLHWWE